MAMHRTTDGTIPMINGQHFKLTEPLHPANPQIPIEAIARGLANTCRFAGQIERYYSVAEHSVITSRMVPPQHARAALMHDGSEALIHDVTKPLKMALPDYQAIEADLDLVIALQYDLPTRMAPEVKAADRAILWIEKRALRGDNSEWEEATAPTPEMIRQAGGIIEIRCLQPQEAYEAFMARAQELGLA